MTHQSLDEYAWYSSNSENKYHKVGLKKPNAWGLYDMLGNVGEWILDQYQPDYYTTITDNAVDPVRQPEARHPRTVKGGAYNDEAKDLRSANRRMSDPVWNREIPDTKKPMVECRCAICWIQDSAAAKTTNTRRSRNNFFKHILDFKKNKS